MAAQTYELEFYGYWREPTIENISDKSGIYCVFSCIHNPEKKTVSPKKLIYIGESSDVKSRLTNHEKLDDWKKHVRKGEVLCFSFAPASPDIRVRCEAAMIFKHTPPVNTEYTNGFPHDKTTVSITGKNTLLETNFTVYRA